MAVLADQDRFDTWAQWMRENRETVPIVKADVRAAINALDDYLNTNAAAINTAIPQPARSALSQTQKAALLTAVIAKRYLIGA